MRLLALETSGITGSTALWDDARGLVAAVALDPTQRSAQSLVPAIHRALREAAWRPADLDVIAVTVGPGSFTGLRIGVTTAKTLAYALQAEVVAVNTLDVLAQQVPAAGSRLWAILDAFRGQLFAATYERDEANVWRRTDQSRESDLPTIDAWLAQFQPGDRVTGPVLAKFKNRLPPEVVAAPEALWQPQATTVAALAVEQYAQGRRDDLWQLVPYYGRLSAAEEKRGDIL